MQHMFVYQYFYQFEKRGIRQLDEKMLGIDLTLQSTCMRQPHCLIRTVDSNPSTGPHYRHIRTSGQFPLVSKIG